VIASQEIDIKNNQKVSVLLLLHNLYPAQNNPSGKTKETP
jgi:hypothetical protein